MNAKTANQEKAFKFLKDKLNSQEFFTKQQFQDATGYTAVSFDTYMAKQFKGLLVPTGSGTYRVSGVFRQFSTWRRFRDRVVTQNRTFGRQYERHAFETVIIFEFYMPLKNEEFLRETLDSLFYEESVKLRLRLIDKQELATRFPALPGEEEEKHFDRICDYVSAKFVGYSIHHVNGRFRAGELRSRTELLIAETKAAEYLIDETTAVVRFIFPCKATATRTAEEDAELLRWLFEHLFVKNILEVVDAEDEVWLLESGMQHKLHIWRAKE